MSAKRYAFALAALAALTLAGCGKQGELERPRPLIGHGVEPNAQTKARQAAAERAREDVRGTARQAPQSVDEVRNDGAQLPPPPPLKGTTIPGTQQPPNPQPPPGGLPDPLKPSTIPR